MARQKKCGLPNAPKKETYSLSRYHSCMRHLLLVLLIVLLPLRSWGGDAMATRMAAPTLTHQLAVAHSGAGQAHAAAAPKHMPVAVEAFGASLAGADCVDHSGSENTSPTDSSHCQSCVVCQACYSSALVLPVFDIGVTFAFSGLPRSAAPRFASAERALGLKPPIS